MIQLASVDGGGVTGVNATTIETRAHAPDCKRQASETVCSATALGSPGDDVFSVTTYAGPNATGPSSRSAPCRRRSRPGGGGVQISNRLSLTLDGVIASLNLSLRPNDGEARRSRNLRGHAGRVRCDAARRSSGRATSRRRLRSRFEGDTQQRISCLHAGAKSGSSLSIVKPTSGITLTYDGNRQASTVTVQASVDGPELDQRAARTSRCTESSRRRRSARSTRSTSEATTVSGATVTEYDGKAKGNAAPERTLQLSTKLYARSIAVDASGNLYVGFFDNRVRLLAVERDCRTPGNLVAIYAPGASGNAQPTALLTADNNDHDDALSRSS